MFRKPTEIIFTMAATSRRCTNQTPSRPSKPHNQGVDWRVSRRKQKQTLLFEPQPKNPNPKKKTKNQTLNNIKTQTLNNSKKKTEQPKKKQTLNNPENPNPKQLQKPKP